MVYFMENPMNKWMIWGVFRLFLHFGEDQTMQMYDSFAVILGW